MARTNAQIADDLEVVVSWMSGARATTVATLVAELRGENAPEPSIQEKRDAEAAAKQQAEAERLAAEQVVAAAAPQKVDTPPRT
jgi:hypothetical protein